jgi:hypothetical protein
VWYAEDKKEFPARLIGSHEPGTRPHDKLWNKLSLVMNIPPEDVEGEEFEDSGDEDPEFEKRKAAAQAIIDKNKPAETESKKDDTKKDDTKKGGGGDAKSGKAAAKEAAKKEKEDAKNAKKAEKDAATAKKKADKEAAATKKKEEKEAKKSAKKKK